MKFANTLISDLDCRIDLIIKQAMDVYVNKVANGLFEVGLEANFQLNLAGILEDLLLINTVNANERFQVILEKNIELNNFKDYIDIVIKYSINDLESLYLIELKNKKISDGKNVATGNILSYIDMYNLELHKRNTKNVRGCYFIFLTDNNYLKPYETGTSSEIPMYDNYSIVKDKVYNVTCDAAIKVMGRYHENGIIFSDTRTIEYTQFTANSKDYWYFLEKI